MIALWLYYKYGSYDVSRFYCNRIGKYFSEKPNKIQNSVECEKKTTNKTTNDFGTSQPIFDDFLALDNVQLKTMKYSFSEESGITVQLLIPVINYLTTYYRVWEELCSLQISVIVAVL
jgi:hypothetical protein